MMRTKTSSGWKILAVFGLLLGSMAFTGKATAATGPVNVDPDDTQNFFSTIGTAQVTPNDDGTWGDISLNEDAENQVGAVSLNMRLNMSKDFHFAWQVKINPHDDYPADGIGFTFHPTYAKGETSITDNQSGGNHKLASQFGRDDTGKPNNSGQTLHSLGLKGGNLGISDLMNVIGFKIDPHNNDGMGTQANTSYGNANHGDGTGNVFGDPDPNIDAMGTPYASFVDTDYTGFAYYPDNGTTAQLVSGGSNLSKIDVIDGNWWNMAINYDATANNFEVTLTNPEDSSESLSWTRKLTKNELATITAKPYWAFSILSSTGANSEAHNIRNVTGDFYPEPSVITRYVDENGTDLKAPQTVNYTDWISNSIHSQNSYTDVNGDTSLTKNAAEYQRSQINQTVYDSEGDPLSRRLTTQNEGTNNVSLITTGNSWIVTTPFGDNASVITYLTYVYRRTNTSTDDLTMNTHLSVVDKTSGASSENGSLEINPQDKLTFTYSVQNKLSGPATWAGVTGVQRLPDGFKVADGQTGITYPNPNDKQIIELPLNRAGETGQLANYLKPNDVGSNTIQVVYDGTSTTKISTKNSLLIGDDNVTNQFYVYDDAPQLIDNDGQPVAGSYFVNVDDANAPLADGGANFDVTDFDNQLANYVPLSNQVTFTSPYALGFSVPTKVDFGLRKVPDKGSEPITYLPIAIDADEEGNDNALKVSQTGGLTQKNWQLAASATNLKTTDGQQIVNSPLVYWQNGKSYQLTDQATVIASGTGTQTLSDHWLKSALPVNNKDGMAADSDDDLSDGGSGLALQFKNNGGTDVSSKKPYTGTVNWVLTNAPG